MRVRVRVMSALSRSTSRELEFPDDTAALGLVLRTFLQRYPLDRQVRDAEGGLRRDVRVFVYDELVRNAWHSDLAVTDGAEIWLVPAVGGG